MGCGAHHSVKVLSTRPAFNTTYTSSIESPLPLSFRGDINKYYSLGATLGYGHYGTVRLAQSVYHSDERFAVKTLCLRDILLTPERVRMEIAILFEMDHPNIIRLFEVFEEKKYFHLVTEYCEGGELFDHLAAKGMYQEAEAAALMRKVLRAISYLHTNSICHRDIKPENFMFAGGELKLIDFGLAAKFEGRCELNSQVGTAAYVAPEVLRGHYTYKCDMWSAGIILYLMVTGMTPYDEGSVGVLQQLSSFQLDLEAPALMQVSDQVKDLLRQLLCPQPEDRPSALEALTHPWLNTAPAQVVHLDPMVLFSLKRFRFTTRLKTAALTLLAKRLKGGKGLKDTFAAMDVIGNGRITLSELEAALSRAGFTLFQSEVQLMVANVDTEGRGQIKYSDFLVATMASKHSISETAMRKTFRYLADNDTFITPLSLQDVMRRQGRCMSDEEAAGIIAEADVSGKGLISFEAFQQVLK